MSLGKQFAKGESGSWKGRPSIEVNLLGVEAGNEYRLNEGRDSSPRDEDTFYQEKRKLPPE